MIDLDCIFHRLTSMNALDLALFIILSIFFEVSVQLVIIISIAAHVCCKSAFKGAL